MALGVKSFGIALRRLAGRRWEDVSADLERFLKSLEHALDYQPSLHVETHLPGGRDEIPTGPPSDLADTNIEGSALAYSRQDHRHRGAVHVQLDAVDAGTRPKIDLESAPLSLWLPRDEADQDRLGVRVHPALYLERNGVKVAYPSTLNFLDARVTEEALVAGLATGLVGYYPLDDSVGSARDVGPGAYHAARTNACVLYERDATYFDSAWALFATPNLPALGQGGVDGASIAFWLNSHPDLGTSYAPGLVVRDMCSSATDIAVYLTMSAPAGRVVCEVNGGAISSTTAAAPSTNAWHHVVATWAAADGKIRLYLDGGAPVVSSAGQAMNAVATRFSIGGWVDRACYAKARMKQLGIWNRLLTAAEIAALPGLRYPYVRVNISTAGGAQQILANRIFGG